MPITKNLIDCCIRGDYDLFIASSYFNVEQFPTTSIQCPYRKDDNPSMALQFYNNRVLFKDFSTGQSGSIVKLLSLIWKVSIKQAAVNIIKGLNNYNLQKLSIKHAHHYKNKNVSITIRSKNWEDESILYWKNYNITVDWLKYAGVIPISYFFINGNVHIADKIAFAYEHVNDLGIIKYKIYQPLNKTAKWFSGCSNNEVSLYDKIPKTGDKIIICSSLKDALCVWSNTGIPCIALQSECMNIPTKVLRLKNKYNKMYIMYDNDKTGIEKSTKLAKENDLINIIIPQFEGGKDISDMMKVLKYNKTVNFIKNAII